jgi:glycosyltransferase involved in cell wall biosynthesis
MKPKAFLLGRPIPADWGAAAKSAGRSPRRGTGRVLIIIENVSLARDHRARKQVQSLLQAGYDVSVICRGDANNKTYLRSERLYLQEYPAPHEFSGKLSFVYEYAYSLLAAFTLALKDFLQRGFQVIQAGQPPDLYFLLALPFKVAGRRFVGDQRDLSPELYAVRYGRDAGAVLWLLHVLERLSWRAADHVFCVNQSLRQTILKRGKLSADKVSVVGNGPVLASTAPRPPRPDLKEGRRFLICWVGLMGPQDHVDLALLAAHYVIHTLGRNDCQFTFIGEGETLPDLQRLTKDLAITDWVTFTGWLDEDGCFDYLATADVGLDTNLQPEVSPVKAMEYLAFGVPLVAFDLQETRATGKQAAAYVTPRDPLALARTISQLLDDPDRRAEMATIGRRRVEEYLCWNHQSEAYLRVYARLLESAGPA